MTEDLLVFAGVVALVGVVGVGLGILAAPALTRLADRLGSDDESEERDGR